MGRMKKRFIMWATNETLYGSFMSEPLEGLGLLVKLVCFSREGRYPGYIQAEYGRGIVPHQLAAILNIPYEEYTRLMEEQVRAKRITIDDKGVIDIVNWDTYQVIPKWNGKPGTDKPVVGKGGKKCTRCSYQGDTEDAVCPRCQSILTAVDGETREGKN